jgi:hypothetical protein
LKGRWVIGWFIDGLGPGWLSSSRVLLPWTGDLSRADLFGSKEDAERKLVEWEIQGLGVGEYWVEELTKAQAET